MKLLYPYDINTIYTANKHKYLIKLEYIYVFVNMHGI